MSNRKFKVGDVVMIEWKENPKHAIGMEKYNGDIGIVMQIFLEDGIWYPQIKTNNTEFSYWWHSSCLHYIGIL